MSLDFRFALARYTTDGSLDTTFSGNGKLTTDFTSSTEERASSIAIDASGRIVVAGIANDRFALARYKTNGKLDTSFCSGGKRTTDFTSSTEESANCIAIDASGRIVVAGYVAI